MKHFYLYLQKKLTVMAKCVLNKGISFSVKVRFFNGSNMSGVLRSHVDQNNFITVKPILANDHMLFTYTAEETLKLISGSCAFEVYEDTTKELMLYCDNFVFARENSISLNQTTN